MLRIFSDTSLIVWAATVLHVVIAMMLLLDTAAGQSTGPAEIVEILGRVPAAVVLLLASGVAVASMRFLRSEWAAVLLFPQQALLYLSAWGGLQAVLNGQYADGVARPYEFILTDQLPLIVLALVHTFAVLEWPWSDG